MSRSEHKETFEGKTHEMSLYPQLHGGNACNPVYPVKAAQTANGVQKPCTLIAQNLVPQNYRFPES